MTDPRITLRIEPELAKALAPIVEQMQRILPTMALTDIYKAVLWAGIRQYQSPGGAAEVINTVRKDAK